MSESLPLAIAEFHIKEMNIQLKALQKHYLNMLDKYGAQQRLCVDDIETGKLQAKKEAIKECLDRLEPIINTMELQ